MILCVQDANILIDLELSSTLGTWLGIGYQTHVTDLIIAEIKQPSHPNIHANIDSGRIQIHRTTSERLSECLQMEAQHEGLTFQDASCHFLALELDAILLTGDKLLKDVSAAEQIEVHGTLWIFDQLVESELLKPSEAAKRLEQLLKAGRRLPGKECQNRIAKWKRS